MSLTGKERKAVSLRFLLSPATEEEVLKEWMKRLGRFCSSGSIHILCADAAVSDAAARDILSVTAVGTAEENGSMNAVVPAPGAHLYMAGYAGAAGTAVLATAQRDILLKRFPAVMLQTAAASGGQLLAPGGWPVEEGGVLAALWEFCERWDLGLEADFHRIPVRQESIEICEYLGLNPYRLYTCGAGLFVFDPAADAMQIR